MSQKNGTIEAKSATAGMISWFDLTVAEAERARDFYAEVCGWSFEPHEMGGYSDYEMKMPQNGETIAGICHQRGPNEYFPPVWLPYVEVDDLDESIRACIEKGGRPRGGVRQMGPARCILLEDPFGAFFVICATERGESVAKD